MAGTEDKKFESVQRLWDAYATILQRRGLDLQLAVGDGTERLRLSLSPPGARADFDELCEKGCAGSVLAFLVFFMRFSPKIRKLWSEMVGEPAKRQDAIRAFQRAVDAIDNIFEDLVKADDELPSDMGGIASPAKVADSLRAYCKLLEPIS